MARGLRAPNLTFVAVVLFLNVLYWYLREPEDCQGNFGRLPTTEKPPELRKAAHSFPSHRASTTFKPVDLPNKNVSKPLGGFEVSNGFVASIPASAKSGCQSDARFPSDIEAIQDALDVSFWKERRGFGKLFGLHNRMVDLAVQMDGMPNENEAAPLLEQLLLLGDDAVVSGLTPNSPAAGVNEMHYLESDALLRHCQRVQGVSLIRHRNNPCWDAERICVDEFRTRCFEFLEQHTLPKRNASFRPRHLVVVGSGPYSTDRRTSEWKSSVELPVSNFHFLEKSYPRFSKLTVVAFDAKGAQHQGSFEQFSELHFGGFTFVPAAPWRHGNGFILREGLGAGHDSTTTCVESIDFASYLRSLPAEALPIVLAVQFPPYATEFALFQHLQASGVLTRDFVAEVFLACRSQFDATSLFPVPTTLSATMKDVLRRAEGHGMDCLLLHDTLRGLGIVTHLWPST